MSEVYCVRAEFGSYTNRFVQGNYIAIGWLNGVDLSAVKTKDELYPIYRKGHPNDTSNIVIGQQVGQIARFLLEIKADDYIITPAAESDLLHVGVVAADPSYWLDAGKDGCPYQHRRKVAWLPKTFTRGMFSVPFQNTIH